MSVTIVLTIIFIVLKLVGVLDWSWWWVFSPMIIDFVAAFALVLFDAGAEKGLERRRNRYNTNRQQRK